MTAPVQPPDETLRRFVERLIGFSPDARPAVDAAMRSIRLAVARTVTLVILGVGDLIPIARAMHARTLGTECPFLVCDPRRLNRPANVRSALNYASGVAAIQAARGGSLAMRHAHPPRDYAAMVAFARDPGNDVLLVVCGSAGYSMDPLVIRPGPVLIPPLHTRASEILRIIDEYATEAIEEMSAQATGFTARERAWTSQNSAATLPDIEKATRRLVALRHTDGNVSAAAAMLGMSHVALTRWLKRRSGRPGKRWSW